MRIEQVEAKPNVLITLTEAEASALVRELDSYPYWSDVRNKLKEMKY